VERVFEVTFAVNFDLKPFWCLDLSYFFKKIVPFRKNQAVNLQTKHKRMPERYRMIVVVLMMLAGSKIFAQQKLTVNEETKPLLMVHPTSIVKIPLVLEKNFYTRHLGVFCKQELIIQKKLSMPVFFRLGSLEYVNRLEGKGPPAPQRGVLRTLK
jgi:hypothetical protein